MITYEIIIRNPKDSNQVYAISPKNNTSIWISDTTGEGAEFKSQMFFDMIDKFYKDNF